jgi:hypothetical protein
LEKITDDEEYGVLLMKIYIKTAKRYLRAYIS